VDHELYAGQETGEEQVREIENDYRIHVTFLLSFRAISRNNAPIVLGKFENGRLCANGG
jgi:hypothetical protein